MKVIFTILGRFFCWVFPVLMFDGCLNRDPYLKVDDHFTISASWSGGPMYLTYRNAAAKWDEELAEELPREERLHAREDYQNRRHWQLRDVTDYSLSASAIIGQSPKGWFVADRRLGVLRLFESSAQRDEAIRKEYHLDDLTSFAVPSAFMWVRSNWLWPWVHLYYAACFILVPSLTIWGYRRKQKQLLDIRARQR